ncbi:dinucleotide-utilizing enzyme [Microbacterium sp. HA-8]|uniref:dinucleotide-utilizing enzyme n=1 Tax=Microbacterium sp. HA-8 TaxID=3234200 RepID=UPI0038F6B819
MATRPRLIRSIPFWSLLVGSLAVAVAGGWLTTETLSGIDARLTDGSATNSDVYVGQVWAIVGAIVLGAGLVGLALAAAIAAATSLLPQRPLEVVEPLSFDDAEEDETSDPEPEVDAAHPTTAAYDRARDEAFDAEEPAQGAPGRDRAEAGSR